MGGQPWLMSMKGNRAAFALYLIEGVQIVGTRETKGGGLPCPAVKLLKKSRCAGRSA